MAGTGRAAAAEALFAGRGDVASRCRAIDWSATPLGPIDGWPECLRPVIRTCLGAPTIPMAIWIGPERILLYNEGYVPLVGSTRHPWALAQPARNVWPELWERLGPTLERVIEHGESIQGDDEHFRLDQGGREEACYACSFVPIRDAREEIVGALSILQETTERVRSTSQQHALLSFALATLRAGAWEFDFDTPSGLRSVEHDRIFGYEGVLPTWTYDTFLAHVVPGDREQVDQTFRRALDTGADWSLECRIRRADGEVRWLWVSGRPVDGRAHGRRRMSGIVQDITDRKRAEEALRASEARLKLAQDAAGAGLWHWDLVTGQWYWSDQLYRLFGWDPQTSAPVTIDTWRAALHPEDRVRAEGHLMRACADGVPVATEDRIVLPSGEVRWVNALGRTTYDAGGRPLSVSGICIDITERKRAQELRRRSEEKSAEALRASDAIARQHLVELETIYETAPIGLCVFDENLRWLRLNRVIAEINGRPIEDHIGRTPSEIVPDIGGQAEEALRTILRTGERLDFEMRGTTAAHPGVERFWSEHWVPMKDHEGRIVGISVAAEEITERKRAAAALAASEERYRTLAENAPEAIGRLDQETRFTYINEYGARLFGMRPGETIGRTFAEIVRDPQVAAFWQTQLAEVTASGEHRTVEGEFESPVFGHQFLSVLLVPERTTPVSILGIARDITPLKQVEDALRKSEAALREANRYKNEFLAWLSHELRNPMNVIRGTLTLIEQAGLESEHAKRALPRLVRQVTLIGRLLDDLLDVTRISKGKIYLQPERVELRELVRAIGEDHREAFDRHRIHFEVLVPDEPVCAEVDPARISQVVGNLLQNAAKFTPAAGHVSLSLRRAPDEQSIIEVRDDGAGIRHELLDRLFEPLVQDERMIAKSQGGLGLGLALVKGLVELHGGTVSLASDGPGHGSVFTVRLPLSLAITRDRDEGQSPRHR